MMELRMVVTHPVRLLTNTQNLQWEGKKGYQNADEEDMEQSPERLPEGLTISNMKGKAAVLSAKEPRASGEDRGSSPILDTTTLKAILAVFDMQYINFTKEKALELANIIGIDTNLEPLIVRSRVHRIVYSSYKARLRQYGVSFTARSRISTKKKKKT
jgi:hypothetical protein